MGKFKNKSVVHFYTANYSKNNQFQVMTISRGWEVQLYSVNKYIFKTKNIYLIELDEYV